MSQPSFYNSLPVCSIMTFRTYYLKENRQIEGWPTLALTPSIKDAVGSKGRMHIKEVALGGSQL